MPITTSWGFPMMHSLSKLVNFLSRDKEVTFEVLHIGVARVQKIACMSFRCQLHEAKPERGVVHHLAVGIIRKQTRDEHVGFTP